MQASEGRRAFINRGFQLPAKTQSDINGGNEGKSVLSYSKEASPTTRLTGPETLRKMPSSEVWHDTDS